MPCTAGWLLVVPKLFKNNENQCFSGPSPIYCLSMDLWNSTRSLDWLKLYSSICLVCLGEQLEKILGGSELLLLINNGNQCVLQDLPPICVSIQSCLGGFMNHFSDLMAKSCCQAYGAYEVNWWLPFNHEWIHMNIPKPLVNISRPQIKYPMVTNYYDSKVEAMNCVTWVQGVTCGNIIHNM